MDLTLQAISQETEIPLPPRPTRNPFHKKPLFLMSLFVLFVIGAFFAGTYYQGMARKTEARLVVDVSPTPVIPVPGFDTVTEWKTYVNEVYGFRISYPSTWTSSFNEEERYPLAQVSFSPVNMEGYAVTVDVWRKDGEAESFPGKDPKAYFQQLYDAQIEQSPSGAGQAKIENTTIGGFPAVKLISHAPVEPTAGEHVYVYKEPYLYDIFSWQSGTYSLDSSFVRTYDQILSTFTFVDPQSSQSATN